LRADEGGKLFERSEFLTAPQSNASRGEPKAKLLGGLFFGSFLCAAQRNEHMFWVFMIF